MKFVHHLPQRRRSWCDLPIHLLSIIAELLGIMELLNFRIVCPVFREAASTATAKIESTPGRALWLLIFGQTSECFLFDTKDKNKYSAYIPELAGSICLASHKGWLLLSQQQSLFLFCPFSLSKIPLPGFPHSDMNGHIAAISSVPTSDNCVISVINRLDEFTLELNVIDLHKSVFWTMHKFECNHSLGTISGAKIHDGVFYFLVDKSILITFNSTDLSWNSYLIVDKKESQHGEACIPFYTSKKDYLQCKGIVDLSWMNLVEEDFTVSIRGTSVEMTDGMEWCVRDEQIGRRMHEEENDSACRFFNGVWIQPRFNQLSMDLL